MESGEDMKRWADILIDNEYRRINIWNVIKWKEINPEFWENNKNHIYSIHKNIEDKVPMIFQVGRNKIYGKSFFKYKDVNSVRIGEGYEESYQHEFFKECFSRMKILNLKDGKDIVKIYVDEAIQEEVIHTKSGRKRIVDVMIRFSKADPMIYVEKWSGKLAIEVYQTHKVDDLKIKEFKDMEIAMAEFNASKWTRITDNLESKEEEEKQFERIIKSLNELIWVKILSDPISREYFSSVRLEEEINKNEFYLEKLSLMKNEIIRLKNEQKKLLQETINYKENEERIKEELINAKNQNKLLKEEVAIIKSKFIYKIFYK